MHAAWFGRPRVVDAFLRPPFSVNINMQGHTNEYTALHCAAYQGHVGVVRTLLAHRPRCDLLNKYGETAAQAALSKGHKNVAEIIKQHCRIHTAAVKKHGATVRGDGASRKGAGLQRRKSPGKSSEAGAADATRAEDASAGARQSESPPRKRMRTEQ